MVRKIRTILWLSGIMIIVCFLAVFFHLSTSALEYSRYNPEWDGTSVFFSSLTGKGAEEIMDLSTLQGRNESLILIIAPYRGFTKREISLYRDFVSNGNTLILADDTGTGNELLVGLESGILINPQNISSIERWYDDPSSVLAFPGADDPLNNGTEVLILNRPASLRGGTAIFSTSVFSWTDLDGNGRINKGEALQRYTIVAREAYHSGTLYVISDPSIFINGMQDSSVGGDNRKILGLITSVEKNVLVDQVHGRTGSAEGMIRLINLIKGSMLVKTVIFFTGIMVVIVIFVITRERVSS